MVALTDREDAESLRTPDPVRFSALVGLLGLFSAGVSAIACWMYF